MIPRFQTKDALISWIIKNPCVLFDEQICFISDPSIPISDSRYISPDLLGIDTNGSFVLVEVRSGCPTPDTVEQVKGYIHDLRKLNMFKALRLFIVGETLSESVESLCECLSKQGINIHQLAIEDIIFLRESKG